MKYKDEEKPFKKFNHMRISEGETILHFWAINTLSFKKKL